MLFNHLIDRITGDRLFLPEFQLPVIRPVICDQNNLTVRTCVRISAAGKLPTGNLQTVCFCYRSVDVLLLSCVLPRARVLLMNTMTYIKDLAEHDRFVMGGSPTVY